MRAGDGIYWRGVCSLMFSQRLMPVNNGGCYDADDCSAAPGATWTGRDRR
jgi:hypothetical protein